MKNIIYSETIRGSKHYVSGQECQDANVCFQENLEDGQISILAVADGHGGAPHYRSAYGANVAVSVAKEVMQSFLLNHKEIMEELDRLEEIAAPTSKGDAPALSVAEAVKEDTEAQSQPVIEETAECAELTSVEETPVEEVVEDVVEELTQPVAVMEKAAELAEVGSVEETAVEETAEVQLPSVAETMEEAVSEEVEKSALETNSEEPTAQAVKAQPQDDADKAAETDKNAEAVKKDLVAKAEADKRALLDKLNTAFMALNEQIFTAWKARVDKDLTENAATIVTSSITYVSGLNEIRTRNVIGYGEEENGELGFINVDLQAQGAEAVVRNPRYLYGSTLLCVGNYKDHYFVVQIGDGDILFVGENGKTFFPIPPYEGMLENETYSLCKSNALNYFKNSYLKEKINFVMLSTDGLPFDEQGLAEFGKEIVYQNILDEPQSIKPELKPLLRSYSSRSKGDDVTVAFLAKNIPEEAYEAFTNSQAAEEDNALESTYVRKLKDYKFNFPAEVTAKKVGGIYKFNELALKLFAENVLVSEYSALVKEKLASNSKSKSIIRVIFTDKAAKSGETSEQDLNNRQTKKYLDAVNEYLKNNPLVVIAFNETNVGLKDNKLDIYTKKDRYGIVKSINDTVIGFEEIDEKQYGKLMNSTQDVFLFNGYKRLHGNYAIEIRKDKIKLIKTKE